MGHPWKLTEVDNILLPAGLLQLGSLSAGHVPPEDGVRGENGREKGYHAESVDQGRERGKEEHQHRHSRTETLAVNLIQPGQSPVDPF